MHRLQILEHILLNLSKTYILWSKRKLTLIGRATVIVVNVDQICLFTSRFTEFARCFT